MQDTALPVTGTIPGSSSTAVTPTVSGGSFFDSIRRDRGVHILWGLVIILIGMVIALRLSKWIKSRIVMNTEQHNATHTIAVTNFMGDLIFYGGLALAIFSGFSVMGFDVSIIVGGLSFAVGWMCNGLISNTVAGVLIMMTRHLHIGDMIEIVAEKSYFGTITEISLRHTTIKTLNYRSIVIPNTTMITSLIHTYSAEPMVRCDAMLSVSYDTPVQQAITVAQAAIMSLPCLINPEKVRIFVKELSDSSIDIVCRFYIDPAGPLLHEQAVALANHTLMNYANANAIEIPYAQTVVHLQQASSQTTV